MKKTPLKLNKAQQKETLENRIKKNLNIYQAEQILTKAYKNKDLNLKNYEAFNEGQRLTSADIHPNFYGHGNDILHGLDPSKNLSNNLGGADRVTKIIRKVSDGKGKEAIIKAPLDWRELGLMRDRKNKYYQEDFENYKKKIKDWQKKKDYSIKNNIDFNKPKPKKPKTFALRRLSDTSGFLDPDFRSTHRDAAFSYLADNVFGLGDYVAKTTVFIHPKTKLPWSAQEFIEGDDIKEDLSNIEHHKDGGNLQKLAAMDVILGNNDRHLGNLKLNKDRQLKLIDNAGSFDYAERFGSKSPCYIRDLLHKAPGLDFHEWVHSIDLNKFNHALDKINAPKELKEIALKRLKTMQEWSTRVRNNPELDQSFIKILEAAKTFKIDGAKSIKNLLKKNLETKRAADLIDPTFKTKPV
jgi:hypothetical protein